MRKKRYSIGTFNENFLRELAREMVEGELLMEKLVDLMNQMRVNNPLNERKEAWQEICNMKEVFNSTLQKNRKLAKDIIDIIKGIKADPSIVYSDVRVYLRITNVEEMYNALVDAESCFYDQITEEARAEIKKEMENRTGIAS